MMELVFDSNRGGAKSRLALWAGAGALMLAPVLAMRLSDEAAGDPGDFVFLAILLAGVGLAIELAARVGERGAYRAGVGVALAAGLLSMWINLAVGIIGSEDDPANLIYAGVLGVAALGAALARFRPAAMAYAMIAAAVAQAAVFVLALMSGLGFTGPITVFFCALWLTAAALFRRAARAKAPA